MVPKRQFTMNDDVMEATQKKILSPKAKKKLTHWKMPGTMGRIDMKCEASKKYVFRRVMVISRGAVRAEKTLSKSKSSHH